MGIIRTLYREGRSLLGMSPPAENGVQRAERVCLELRGSIGGKHHREDSDYILETEMNDRPAAAAFHGDAGNWTLKVGLDDRLPRFDLAGGSDPQEGPGRRYVGSKIYVATSHHEELWQALPTGARGTAAQLLEKSPGELDVGDGVLTYTALTETMAGRSARYDAEKQLQTLIKLAEAMESSW